MPTLKQIEAARRNGAKSKGPVSPEGKQRSAQNAATHGLSAKKIFVLANESAQMFDQLVAGFVEHYQPANDLEHELCLNIAYAHWRIRRLAIIETGIFDKELVRHSDQSVLRDGEVDEGIRLACAFESLTTGSGALAHINRYESRLYRTFHQLIDRLDKIQSDRRAAAAEPKMEAGQRMQNEPEPSTPAAPPSETLQNEPGNPSTATVIAISQNEPNEPRDAAVTSTYEVQSPDERKCA